MLEPLSREITNDPYTSSNYDDTEKKLCLLTKGRTIRKVMGGEGKKPKKNSCKGKCQEKKFVQTRR